eukprot:TRINITY_DN4800_c0_g1_i2.p1 TRINITY_DN4800_c0_g1~~TRINITY_DN4800_c0_g1_i2.p1  ORF type:complete len:263 (+),score=90.05 TRINITY_DN4800_c0_g1_i2:97-885(+)
MESNERVFSVLDMVVLVLIMVLSFIWSKNRITKRFYEACKSGDIETVREIMDKNKSGSVFWSVVGPNTEQLSIGLMWACSEGRERVVERLMESEDIFQHRFSLASCLMCACKRGYRECVRILLMDERVPVNTINKEGLTPEEVTEDELIKDMLRQGHWKRVKSQVKEIGDTVGLSIENLQEIEEDDDNQFVAKALEIKNKEILKKVELIESKELVEYEKLKKKFADEKKAVQDQFNCETDELRTALNEEILQVKSVYEKYTE